MGFRGALGRRPSRDVADAEQQHATERLHPTERLHDGERSAPGLRGGWVLRAVHAGAGWNAALLVVRLARRPEAGGDAQHAPHGGRVGPSRHGGGGRPHMPGVRGGGHRGPHVRTHGLGGGQRRAGCAPGPSRRRPVGTVVVTRRRRAHTVTPPGRHPNELSRAGPRRSRRPRVQRRLRRCVRGRRSRPGRRPPPSAAARRASGGRARARPRSLPARRALP